MTQIRGFLIICALLLFSALAGCSQNTKEKMEENEELIYKEARRLLDAGRNDLAIEQLEYLQSLFPFGPYAEQGQLELMYALFRSSRYEEAVDTAQRFTLLHPNHPRIDYAQYLQGLAAFRSQRGLLDSYLPIDLSRRDLTGAKQALDYFTQLLTQHPNSPYAADTRQRMIDLRNLLARQEISIANQYLREAVWIPALNRAQYVVRNYQGTTAMPDALAIMVFTYNELGGMQELATGALRTLKQNYPDYPGLNDRGELQPTSLHNSKWFLPRMLEGILPPKIVFDSREQYNGQIPDADAIDRIEP